MYQNVAILAAVVLLYSCAAGRVAGSRLSGPILFTFGGLLLGPLCFGLLQLSLTAAELKAMAEAALAMVLFSDAAHADLAVVRRTVGLPERLLLIGLPLTIGMGFVVAVVLFPGLNLFGAALLASLLAPTDAALGAPVVTNEAVPPETREALNLESGLNDGICVPVVIILLDLAIGLEVEHATFGHALWIIIEEIGIGLVAGILLPGLAVALVHLATRRGWISAHWVSVPAIALAALCFGAAQAAGGSGFIACFVGGLFFGYLKGGERELLGGVAMTGEVLALLTWVVFGGVVVAAVVGRITAAMVLYAVLSLTLIRILPVFLSLVGSGLSTGSKLFIGWFGPRGLASIVFAVLVFDSGAPGKEIIAAAAACTVLLSVVAHGATANPSIELLRRTLSRR